MRRVVRQRDDQSVVADPDAGDLWQLFRRGPLELSAEGSKTDVYKFRMLGLSRRSEATGDTSGSPLWRLGHTAGMAVPKARVTPSASGSIEVSTNQCQRRQSGKYRSPGAVCVQRLVLASQAGSSDLGIG
jgi:hypothetical protein